VLKVVDASGAGDTVTVIVLIPLEIIVTVVAGRSLVPEVPDGGAAMMVVEDVLAWPEVADMIGGLPGPGRGAVGPALNV
jgi:hypothetical protein